MICFVNRYLEGLDGVKFQIRFEGKLISGQTTANNYCFEVQPQTLNPIRVAVWSRRSNIFKYLDDVVPELGKCKLVRKVLATAKVISKTERHPERKPDVSPMPSLPPPTPPGPSPDSAQGVIPASRKNERDEPQTQATRPVPATITVAQLRKIFTDPTRASDAYLQSVADELNVDLTKFKLDTPLRRAHFFAQVKGETGNGMKPKTEDWEFSPEALKTFSTYYAKHPKEAVEDGYLKDAKGRFRRHANQDAIGKKHYLRLNGNRLDHPDDGSKYRGRGLLQITGYEKYSGFMNDYGKLWSGPAPNSVNDPEIVVKFPFSVRSAVWFWLKKKVYELADKGATPAHVEQVSIRVNGGKTGLKERQDAFKVSYPAFK